MNRSVVDAVASHICVNFLYRRRRACVWLQPSPARIDRRRICLASQLQFQRQNLGLDSDAARCFGLCPWPHLASRSQDCSAGWLASRVDEHREPGARRTSGLGRYSSNQLRNLCQAMKSSSPCIATEHKESGCWRYLKRHSSVTKIGASRDNLAQNTWSSPRPTNDSSQTSTRRLSRLNMMLLVPGFRPPARRL